jgi:metal transporter CNNM
MAPAPRARVPRGKVITDVSRKPSEQPLIDVEEHLQPTGDAPRKLSLPESSDNPPLTSFLMRRRSSGNKAAEPLRSDDPELYRHLKHLGPSNAASRPKSTRINTVKIKPSIAPTIPQTIPENEHPPIPDRSSLISPLGVVLPENNSLHGGVGEGLLASAGREASDGVHSVAVGYGTMAPSGDRMSWKSGRSGLRDADDEPRSPKSNANGNDYLVVGNTKQDDDSTEHDNSRQRSRSVSTIASLRSARSRSKSPPKKRHTARSGSISENIVDVNGIKKIVLETTSSSDSDDKILLLTPADGAQDDSKEGHSDAESANPGSQNGSGKKKRKKRGKKKKGNAGDSSESQPLLGEK